jgi:hypothetical protein
MKKKEKSVPQKILFPAVILITFWIPAIVLSQSTKHIFYLFNFGYIGTSLGFGTGLYSLLPRKRKPFGRKVAQLLVGGYMLGFLGFGEHADRGFFLLSPLRLLRRSCDSLSGGEGFWASPL